MGEATPPRGPGHCDNDAAWAEFCRQYDGKGRDWCGGAQSDFAVANAVFMADRGDLNLIQHQTNAKERIRWLSIQLALATSYQERVEPWLIACFGELIAGDREERNHRFLEEALELVQACGCTAHEAHQLVDYVYGRPVGEPAQEVGGVMVTLAALCLANGLDMQKDGETELARVWTKVEQIRAKQAAKPKHSPLPGLTPAPDSAAPPEPVERTTS